MGERDGKLRIVISIAAVFSVSQLHPRHHHKTKEELINFKIIK